MVDMSGFSYRRNLDGSAYVPSLVYVYGNDSAVIQVGDIIRIDQDGLAALATAGSTQAGVVAGVVDKNGLPVTPDAGTTDTWTMSSTNSSVAYHKVAFIPALPNYLFFNDSSGTLAQTNLFQYADLTNEHQVNQGSLTDTATAQVRLIEIDPDGDGDASKGLFQIVESQFDGIAVNVAA